MCMLNRKEVLRRTTFANAQIYRIADFPTPATLSENRRAWYEAEMDTFLLSRPRVIEDGLTYPDLEPPKGVRVMTEKQVCDYTSISRANLNRMIRDGRFPSPIKLSVAKIGYLKHEVDHWLKSLPRADWLNGTK
ncbi:MAG: AlpA family phage regulatory protein [Alphaproteobacteria bacterium]|nr:AlpA family phage regulatory protein [Alphaproteobacteria bacterium]